MKQITELFQAWALAGDLIVEKNIHRLIYRLLHSVYLHGHAVLISDMILSQSTNW